MKKLMFEYLRMEIFYIIQKKIDVIQTYAEYYLNVHS